MIRSFNRFELKYLISTTQAGAVSADLLGFLSPDRHGEGGRYALTSLYYDSADLSCYWAKIDGLKVRRKLRIRHYESAAALDPADPVFVEIKQRVNRVTQKRRVQLPYAIAQSLCEGVEPDDVARADAAVVTEVVDMVRRFDLRPTAITSYMRDAFVGGELDPGVRVTFDRGLRYRTGNLDLHRKNPGAHLLPPDLVVMEVKVNDRVPTWLTRLVSHHNLTLVRISKYCAAIEAGRFQRGPSRIDSLAPTRSYRPEEARHG